MVTPSHLIYSWALAKYTEKSGAAIPLKARTSAFLLGGVLPDVPVFVFFAVCGLWLGYGHETLWDDMYFNSNWSIAFTLSHSLLCWPLLALLATVKKWYFWRYLSVSACFHVIVDFCVHTADAYQHFWPLSNWRFISPISYWDRAAYGQYVGLFDAFLVSLLLTWLFAYYQNTKIKWVVLAVGVLSGIRLLAELVSFSYYG